MHDDELKRLARIGALEQCRRAVAMFPDLLGTLNREARGGASSPTRDPIAYLQAMKDRIAAVEVNAARVRRTRRKWKPAAKRRLAASMRRAWAKRKAARKAATR